MKAKPDPKSFKFLLWVYFIAFAIALMIVLWLLQIGFLQTYYEHMKTREILNAADSIAGDYGDLDLDEMREFSYKDDMFIHIETESGLIIYTADDGYQRPSRTMVSLFDLEMVKARINKSEDGTVSFIYSMHPGNMKTLVYGKKIQSESGETAYLSIFAPLTPLKSTVDILAGQLVLVTIVSLLLACFMAFVISRNVTKPLDRITGSAAELAKGKYDLTFDGGHYSEFIKLADTLTYTSSELAKIDRLQKDLIANVSHDLRTPLTMIKSYAEMIRDLSGNNATKRSAHLNVIIDEADRLNLLVSDFLMLSQMQSGATMLESETFSIHEVAQSIVNSYGVLIEREAYQITLHCEEELFAIGDPRRIKQVLSNFINNAVRYSGDRKEVQIHISRIDEEIRCEVIDFGEGIPKEELDHIWERYYKVHRNNADGPSGGSGLGLAIVKEILHLHNSRYGVTSEVGQGSTFWFTLKIGAPLDCVDRIL